ncbi:hypothetical protein Tco_0278309 [Tanacetum coccineum]
MRDIVRSKTERELVRVKFHDENAFWNEIEVNVGVSKLMLLSLNLLLPVLVYAARNSLTAVRHKLMLPGITYYCWVNTALIDKKKMIITEKSVRSDLMLEDAEGTECLPNDVIFEQLTLIGAKTTAWNEFSSTMASAIICLATNKKFNFSKYNFDNMMKNLEGGVKFLMYPRFVQVFLDKQENHPLFPTMMVQALANIGEDSTAPIDSHSTPIITQPSLSKPQKKKSRRKQRKDSGPTEPIPDVATNKEPTSTPSCNPPQSGKDRLQLAKLMTLCTKLQKQVLDLEEAKTAQAKEIANLKKRVKQLKRKRKSRTSGLKMLKKVGLVSRVESSSDVSLERFDEEMLFDVQDDLQGEEVVAEKEVAEKEVSAADLVIIAGEVVTIASATTTVDELTLAQTLMEIKAAKPKAVTTTATTITTVVASTRPKAKGIAKDKGKGKIVEPKKTLKKKDQIALDEELTLKLQAEEQAELEKKELHIKKLAEKQLLKN